MLKGHKTADKLISEDGSTELLPKGRGSYFGSLSKVPFELIGYLPLAPDLEEQFGEYFADVSK